MPKNSSPQVFEPRDRIIGETGSLVAFLTLNDDSYVSFLDHVYVVCTVTDWQGSFPFAICPYEFHDLGFVGGRRCVHYNGLGVD